MKNLSEAQRIIAGSKQYEFDDETILVITDLSTGEKICLDLAKLDEATLERLQVGSTLDDLRERCRTFVYNQLDEEETELVTRLLQRAADEHTTIQRLDWNEYQWLAASVFDFLGREPDAPEDFDVADFINNYLY